MAARPQYRVSGINHGLPKGNGVVAGECQEMVFSAIFFILAFLSEEMGMRIFVCEDHMIIIDGLKLLFDSHPEFELVGYTKHGDELLDGIRKTRPDLLLLDLNLKDTDGFSLLEMIRAQDRLLKVFILTMYQDESLIDRAKKLGANGFLPKNISNNDLILAIRSAGEDAFYLPAMIRRRLDEKISLRDRFVDKMKLTPREIDIIRCIARGQSSIQIAGELNVSENTVETHRKNIFKKARLSNVAELVSFAYENHIL